MSADRNFWLQVLIVFAAYQPFLGIDLHVGRRFRVGIRGHHDMEVRQFLLSLSLIICAELDF